MNNLELVYYNQFRVAIEEENIGLVREYLKSPNYDPSANNSTLIGEASESGLIDIVTLLLNDPRVDPSRDANYAIKMAMHNYEDERLSNEGYLETIELLWSDNRVKSTLEKNSPHLYEKLIKENIKNKVKDF